MVRAVADRVWSDEEKEVLEAIVAVLDAVADENDLTGHVSDVSHPLVGRGWKFEGSQLGSYIKRLRRWMQTTTEAFVMACVLMKRLDEQGCLPTITQTCVHKVFLSCLVVVIKSHEDETLSNIGFAKVGGVSVQQLSVMEKHVIFSLNWRVQVSQLTCKEMKFDMATAGSLLPRPADQMPPHPCGPLTLTALVEAKPCVLSRQSSSRKSRMAGLRMRAAPSRVGGVSALKTPHSFQRQDSC